MRKIDFINDLIRSNGYRSYLEIGTAKPERNFLKVECGLRVGTDPHATPYHKERNTHIHPFTSDHFFEKYPDEKFDIVFIDGLHLARQVIKDVCNASLSLTENGVILLHDTNPPDESYAGPCPKHNGWCGTVWQGIMFIRQNMPNWLVETDLDGFGMTKITPEYRGIDMKYKAFLKNKQYYLAPNGE